VCKNYNQDNCELGENCIDNHPKKNCTYWIRGNCNRGYNCPLRHSEQKRENSPQKEYPRIREIKENNTEEQTAKYESKVEQMVNAVKEGFKSQNDLLSTTLKGTNQEQQNIPINQAQQVRVLMHQAQPSPIMYAQNFPKLMPPTNQNIPQLMPPTNPYQLNQSSLFNIQPDTFTVNNIKQKLPNLPNL